MDFCTTSTVASLPPLLTAPSQHRAPASGELQNIVQYKAQCACPFECVEDPYALHLCRSGHLGRFCRVLTETRGDVAEAVSFLLPFVVTQLVSSLLLGIADFGSALSDRSCHLRLCMCCTHSPLY